ncbi:MAG: methylenetetrahydrofolate reductase C-terminal domain-containing protein [Chloroflexota bacterium]
MIVAEQKPLEEIRSMISGHKKILVLGCGTCVTVCFAGGQKEAGVLASSLRMAEQLAGNQVEIRDFTITRQCDPEYVAMVQEQLGDADLILSLACGVGVQSVAEAYKVRVVPGLNTKFMGRNLEHGVWSEACAGCGDCILEYTGGICPIARCAKSIFNGPCGGSSGGKCEISPDVPCAWQLIYDRLTALGMVDKLTEIREPKDWSTARDGGPRKIVREDLQISQPV